MKTTVTRTPYPPPYPDKPRKEKVVPVKHDIEKRRCSKFYCVKVKANACCNMCPISIRCEFQCYNDRLLCNCLTDVIKGKSTMIIVGG